VNDFVMLRSVARRATFLTHTQQ